MIAANAHLAAQSSPNPSSATQYSQGNSSKAKGANKASNSSPAKTSGHSGSTAKHGSSSSGKRISSAHNTSAHSGSSAHGAKTKYASTRGKKRTTARGQQKIDPERAGEIQEALIREHYLTGAAAGKWDQASEDAMRRYQADHGWQSKTVPDARALISLGLGPSHDHLLNPESAMTTGPEMGRGNSIPAGGVESTNPAASTPLSPPANASQGGDGPQ